MSLYFLQRFSEEIIILWRI